MILVSLLILFGLVVFFGSLATAYWLALLRCVMDTLECQTEGRELFMELMFSVGGIVFWATCLLGLYMVWWGFRVKSHHLQKNIKTFRF